MIDLAAVDAIDVHVHTELHARRTRPDAARAARGRAARTSERRAAPDRRRRRRVLPRAGHRRGRLHGRLGVAQRDRRRSRTRRSLDAAAANADVLIPFASVDPARPDAVERVRAPRRRRRRRGSSSTRTSRPSSRTTASVYPLYEAIAEAGLPALFHSGHSGIGTGVPGGGGLRLKYSNPMCLDDVAADFPDAPDRARPPVVPVAGRGDLDLPAQGRTSGSTSPAGRRSTSRRSSSSTRTPSSGRRCCSAPTSR